MEENRRRKAALKRQVREKERARAALARLPIEEKLNMIAVMQRRANEIRRAVGRPVRPEWPLK